MKKTFLLTLLTIISTTTLPRDQDTYYFPATKLSNTEQARYVTQLFDSMKMHNSANVSGSDSLIEQKVNLCLSNLTLRSWLDLVAKNNDLFGEQYAEQLYIQPTKKEIEANKKQIGMSCNKVFDLYFLGIENRYKQRN
ncbi:TPA: hypothetical protein ACJTOE_004612 [Klebsiella aerogenes]